VSRLRDFESKFFGKLRRPAPTGWVRRSAFWLLLVCVATGLLGLLPGNVGAVFQAISDLVLVVLVPLGAMLLVQYIFGHFLWKVRNRLILTYLLMGLAPVVLFVTLAGVSLYIFSGQFAIFAGTAEEHAELVQIAAQNRVFANRLAQEVAAGVPLEKLSLPGVKDVAAMKDFPDMRLAIFVDGKPVTMMSAGHTAESIPGVPDWAGDRDFQGIVFDQGHLYLRAIDNDRAGQHRVAVISSVPLGQKNVDRIAAGLGTVTILPTTVFAQGGSNETVTIGPSGITESRNKASGNQSSGAGASGSDGAKTADNSDFAIHVRAAPEKAKQGGTQSLAALEGAGAVTGGLLPKATHFYDIPVTFAAPLQTTNWQTGKTHEAIVHVNSRPSLLYQRLFNTSLRVGNIFRDVLIGLATFFGLLELFAFYGAMRLNQTITKSIRDLYSATEAIDHGDFEHRIVVKRRDQLASLSQSFNNMAASLARLLQEQKEKQKLQSELAIAQEVQANLFPGANLQMGPLEVYGICLPARTVSGDYYDFLVLSEKSMGLALGDISGKGISAALLMATLYSAVRAYRFAGHEMALAAQNMLAKAGQQNGEFEAESGRLFTQPASVMKLLNRHLYRSTQPAKYATLFLAHLEVETRQLTYANGGQLPPLLLRSDGSVDRLDLGGTVVGLIDNVAYEQGVEHMYPGDILIAYSDGVTEPENEFGDFGEDRLVDVVQRHRHLPLEVIASQVMNALRAWIGDQEQPDDITLVLARYGHAEG
jgi:sigma-B regulation protein RsbU (phosphoserine phosphatase)